MGGVCGIGSIKGRLSPIGSLQGALSIPVGGGLDCDIYEGKYNIVPSDTVQVLPTANKLLKHDIVIEANSGGLPEGSEMATDDDIDGLIDDIFGIKITTLAQLKVALQAAKTYIDGQIGGLGTMAGKSEVAYDDLAAALKTLIDGKAAQATVDTLVGAEIPESLYAPSLLRKSQRSWLVPTSLTTP